MHNIEFPLISVIVPIYKVQKYLIRCIDSIIVQTYKNIEIILVDDGSPDLCPIICDDYKTKDQRIIVIHKQNEGLSEARNSGITASRGEFIAFIDSDDYVRSDYIEKMYFALKKNNADLVICNFQDVDERGYGLYVDESPIKNEILTKEKLVLKYTELSGYYYVVVWNKLYKKSVIGNVKFPKGKIHEDEFTCHLFAANCRIIVTIQDKLYYYVRRNSGIMGCLNNKKDVRCLDRVEAQKERINFQYNNKITENIDILFLRNYYEFISLKNVIGEDNARVKEIESDLKIMRDKIYSCLSVKTRILSLLPLSIYDTCFIFKERLIKFKCFRKIYYCKQNLKAQRDLENSDNFVILKKIGKKIILLNTPCHGNLGDHAICNVEMEIVKQIANDVPVISFTHDEWLLCKNKLCKYITSNDIILLPGGGFIGDLWLEEHEVVCDVLKTFKRNKILIFPQTVYFKSEDNENALNFVKTANSCSNLTITVRDITSKNILENLRINADILYVPDTVLLYRFTANNNKRNGKALVCLRDDKEKIQDTASILKILDTKNITYDISSTTIKKQVYPHESQHEVEKKLQEFSLYSFVICDRLHAMIFAAITGTPCVAFDNCSKKVSGVYEWLKDSEYIYCINNIEKLNKEIDRINKNQKYNFDSVKIKSYFTPLIEKIMNLL